ncbi:hypothetical protein PLICRDRAFT_613430 [Plicaturopsis crispa FD-325 SS-3]|nr:hypothetical protein PLICRDRAFT_613430 [Plicaturopsis crispa FD-325 SS-3]
MPPRSPWLPVDRILPSARTSCCSDTIDCFLCITRPQHAVPNLRHASTSALCYIFSITPRGERAIYSIRRCFSSVRSCTARYGKYGSSAPRYDRFATSTHIGHNSPSSPGSLMLMRINEISNRNQGRIAVDETGPKAASSLARERRSLEPYQTVQKIAEPSSAALISSLPARSTFRAPSGVCAPAHRRLGQSAGAHSLRGTVYETQPGPETTSFFFSSCSRRRRRIAALLYSFTGSCTS